MNPLPIHLFTIDGAHRHHFFISTSLSTTTIFFKTLTLVVVANNFRYNQPIDFLKIRANRRHVNRQSYEGIFSNDFFLKSY
jgi:hypothetical protein